MKKSKNLKKIHFFKTYLETGHCQGQQGYQTGFDHFLFFLLHYHNRALILLIFYNRILQRFSPKCLQLLFRRHQLTLQIFEKKNCRTKIKKFGKKSKNFEKQNCRKKSKNFGKQNCRTFQNF